MLLVCGEEAIVLADSVQCLDLRRVLPLLGLLEYHCLPALQQSVLPRDFCPAIFVICVVGQSLDSTRVYEVVTLL